MYHSYAMYKCKYAYNDNRYSLLGLGCIGKYLITVCKIKYCTITKYRLHGFIHFKAKYLICLNTYVSLMYVTGKVDKNTDGIPSLAGLTRLDHQVWCLASI